MNRRSVVARQTSTNFKQIGFIFRQIVLIFIPIVLIIWIPRQPFLQIQKFDCQIDASECNSEVLKKLEPYLHQFVFSIQPHQIDQKLLTDSRFENSKTEVQFPNTLKIRISSQKNLLNIGFVDVEPIEQAETIQATSSATPSASPHPILKDLPSLAKIPNKYYSLTKSGTLLDSTSSEANAYILGTELPDKDKLVTFYSLFFELFQSGLNIDKVWYTNRWVGVRLKTGPLVVFSDETDPLKSVTTLQQILAQATMDLTQAVIDLRFNKPVITNNP